MNKNKKAEEALPPTQKSPVEKPKEVIPKKEEPSIQQTTKLVEEV